MGSSQAVCSGGQERYGYWVTFQGQRVIQACDDGVGPCANFGYDELNRLTSRSPISGGQNAFTYVYDRYGNRWQENPNGAQLSFDSYHNLIDSGGFSYDAVGNLKTDSIHTYTYDAEGNLTTVDGGATAKYTYNALNQRVRVDVGATAQEFVFNPNGQRTSIWDGNDGQLIQGQAYWGIQPLEFYSDGFAHFEHLDWLGTKRVTTNNTGVTEATFSSMPFGDFYNVTGGDYDSEHYALLDSDAETSTQHAQYRQYSPGLAGWLQPDPYDGSYDLSNPQSLNRYSYVLNNPLTFTDPLGLDYEFDCGDNCVGVVGRELASFGQYVVLNAS
jgi:RHS repeat-associated protein